MAIRATIKAARHIDAAWALVDTTEVLDFNRVELPQAVRDMTADGLDRHNPIATMSVGAPLKSRVKLFTKLNF